MGNEKSTSKGIGFFALLGLLFIGLKLAGFINWSWWWVLLPLYGGIGIVVVILLIVLIISILGR